MNALLRISCLCLALGSPASAEEMAGLGVRSGGAPVATSDQHYDIVPPTAIPRELETPSEEQPLAVRLIIHPVRRGIFLSLPVVDTDPNRGVTTGFMPIWVVQDRKGERIEHIHAPSFTYNRLFQVNSTYRYYYYPTPDSDLQIRGSWATVSDREAMGKFNDRHFLGLDLLAGLKVQYDVDGSNRFFGVGPNTKITAESNYTMDTIQYALQAGLPVIPDDKWMLKVAHRLESDAISNGPIAAIPSIDTGFPGAAPAHRHQHAAYRLETDYDTRDNQVTTRQGSYAGFYAETSQRSLGGEYVSNRYGVDLRRFCKIDPASRYTAVGAFKFEQLVGDVPFWLMPQLGGKYVHRAYGEGRYIDKGFFSAQAEERIGVHEARMGGVTTEFELAPFAGVGTVFSTPRRAAWNYLRPVVGGALRAVARPQVVGSIDFGLGQEGVSVFMDINYSF